MYQKFQSNFKSINMIISMSFILKRVQFKFKMLMIFKKKRQSISIVKGHHKNLR